MNRITKHILILFLLVFVSNNLIGQKFATHSVKKGETLESLAKHYKVTTANILTYNKEIRAGQELKSNTILVIPVDAAAIEKVSSEQTSSSSNTANGTEAKEEQEKPIGFTSYKVKKKETLYSIAKRFNITEEDIKRYNRSLYSEQLKKKMVLRIPKYKRVKPEESNLVSTSGELETYTVAAKETRWSIAHKFGITVERMLELNPALAKNSNYLAEGQELQLPKRDAGVQNQVTELYRSYTVPPKMNFYRLEQEFGVKSDEIVRLNPEITEKGGLKEGMVIRIPEKKITTGTVNTDNYNFYEVKPKQTEFSLTRKLGVSYKELLKLNPDLNEGLKAGMVLKLPKDQTGNFEVRNALVLDKINLIDSINVSNHPKVLFMFPFRLNKLDVSDEEELVKIIKGRKSLQGSLGLYSGALVALDSIASLGISVDVKTFDNQYDVAKTKAILATEDLADVSAIVGPLDLASLKEVAAKAGANRVPVIAPTPVATKLSASNVFFSYTDDKVLQDRMLNYMNDTLVEKNIIVIADAANVKVKDAIVAKFPEAKVVVVTEEKKNIGINRDKVAALLSEEIENWVIVETDNFRLASSVTSILNSFHNTPLDPEVSEKKIFVRMFTTDKNDAFDNEVISNSHLSNLNFTYPSVFREVSGSDAFAKRYRKRFGDSPDRYAVRGFDITYDLLLKLAYKNNLIEASKLIGETAYSGNRFSYEKEAGSGYFNQASFIMMYEDMRIKEVKE